MFFGAKVLTHQCSGTWQGQLGSAGHVVAVREGLGFIGFRVGCRVKGISHMGSSLT